MAFFKLAYDCKRATGAWNKLKQQRESESVAEPKKEK